MAAGVRRGVVCLALVAFSLSLFAGFLPAPAVAHPSNQQISASPTWTDGADITGMCANAASASIGLNDAKLFVGQPSGGVVEVAFDVDYTNRPADPQWCGGQNVQSTIYVLNNDGSAGSQLCSFPAIRVDFAGVAHWETHGIAGAPNSCPVSSTGDYMLKLAYSHGPQIMGTATTRVSLTDLSNLTCAPEDSTGAVNLAWTNDNGAGTVVRVERRPQSGVWSVLSQNVNGAAWVDETAVKSRTYQYRVTAGDGNGTWTMPSETCTVTTTVEVDPNDKGQQLSCEQVAALAYRAGVTQETQLVVMTAIARGESSFLTKAVSYTGCCVGLWQIHLQVWNVSKAQMEDPVANAEMMFHILQSQGLDAWEAYTGPDGEGSDGPWLNHKSYVEQSSCVPAVLGNGGAAADTIENTPDLGEQDNVPDPDKDNDGVPDGESESVSCGFSMFCWIKAAMKWAFVPKTAGQQWNELYDLLSRKPPMSIALGGIEFIGLAISQGQNTSGTGDELSGDLACAGVDGNVTDPNNTMLDICADDLVAQLTSDSTVGSILAAVRRILVVMVYTFAGFQIWKRAGLAIGIMSAESAFASGGDSHAATTGDPLSPLYHS